MVIIDQATKLAVHTEMQLGEEISVVGNWFKLNYILNPGMAYGMQLDSEYGKLALSLFRMIATFLIGGYLYHLIKKRMHSGFLVCIALILGGAMGNLIDSVFYGVWLDNTVPGAATPWLHGQVIDMLYFPLMDGFFPEWLPVWGGEYFLFFRPVFNIADASIFVGVACILIFQNRFFLDEKKEKVIPGNTIIEERKVENEG